MIDSLRVIPASLRVQDIFEDYSSNRTKRGAA